MAKKKKVPELRFKESVEEWKGEKLGEVTKVTMGQSPQGINYTNNSEDHILVQGNADMKDGHVIPRVWTTQVTKIANVGDIIISVRAPVGEVGITDYKVVLGRGVAAITGNSFFYQSLIRMNEFGYWKRLSCGSTFDSINSNILKDIAIVIPNKKEQSKIGSYFQSLDTLIALHQRKHEKLCTLKKALLEKMFPKEGADVPETRFIGFSGKWERKRLEEIASLRGGFAFQSYKFLSEGIPIIKIGNILPDGTIDGDFNYYAEQANDENYSLPNGAALLAMSGATTGKVSILCNPDNEKMYQNQRVGYFQNSRKAEYSFVTTLVRSDLFTRQLNSVLVAGAQPNVSSKEINAFEFYFPPEKKEQEKIGTFFKKLDSLIALQQRELGKLKNIKKACLEKMFI